MLMSETPAMIVTAVRAVATMQAEGGGKQWLSPRLGAQMLRELRERAEIRKRFTARELEVLRLLGRGWTNGRIGKTLGISERTVRFHLSNCYDKMDVCSRTEAVVWMQKKGLFNDN